MRKNNRGITLIALVITIIILLILAGVTIGQLTGNGLFDKAKLAKEKSEQAQEDENKILGNYEDEIDKYIYNSRNNSMQENDFITEDSNYETKKGELEFSSLGLKAKTYEVATEDDNIGDYNSICTAEKVLEKPIQLNGKFEISTRVHINNKNTANMGGIYIDLYEKENGEYKNVSRIGIWDAWVAFNKMHYTCNIKNIDVMKPIEWSTVNGSGIYGVIGDGKKAYFYFGDECLSSVDFSNTANIDKVVIKFFR